MTDRSLWAGTFTLLSVGPPLHERATRAAPRARRVPLNGPAFSARRWGGIRALKKLSHARTRSPMDGVVQKLIRSCGAIRAIRGAIRAVAQLEQFVA